MINDNPGGIKYGQDHHKIVGLYKNQLLTYSFNWLKMIYEHIYEKSKIIRRKFLSQSGP